MRNAYAEAVRNDEITSTRVSDETLILEEAIHYVDAGEEEGAQWKRIRSSLNQPVEKFKRKDKGKNVAAAWGKATAIIHATPELVLSWQWFLDSNGRKKVHIEFTGDLIRRVKYIPQSRTQLCDFGYSFPGTNRLFSVKSVWGKNSSSEGVERFVITGKTRDMDKKDFDAIERDFGKFIKVGVKQVFVIEKIAPSVCRATYAAQIDLRGRIPTALMDTQISNALDILKGMYEKFERRGKDVEAEVGCADGFLVARE